MIFHGKNQWSNFEQVLAFLCYWGYIAVVIDALWQLFQEHLLHKRTANCVFALLALLVSAVNNTVLQVSDVITERYLLTVGSGHLHSYFILLMIPWFTMVPQLWKKLVTVVCHFYRAMLCIRGTSHGPVSVSLSVRLSQVGVLLEWLNVGSHKQHHTIAQGI